jgi:hypothetical protein
VPAAGLSPRALRSEKEAQWPANRLPRGECGQREWARAIGPPHLISTATVVVASRGDERCPRSTERCCNAFTGTTPRAAGCGTRSPAMPRRSRKRGSRRCGCPHRARRWTGRKTSATASTTCSISASSTRRAASPPSTARGHSWRTPSARRRRPGCRSTSTRCSIIRAAPTAPRWLRRRLSPQTTATSRSVRRATSKRGRSSPFPAEEPCTRASNGTGTTSTLWTSTSGPVTVASSG